MSADWTWFGQAGHFIGAASCLFHLHTHIGKYCVSTIGEYHPRSAGHRGMEEPTEIGCDRIYETMVFELGEDGKPESWSEIDMHGYSERSEAAAGHMKMCRKYAEEAGK